MCANIHYNMCVYLTSMCICIMHAVWHAYTNYFKVSCITLCMKYECMYVCINKNFKCVQKRTNM